MKSIIATIEEKYGKRVFIAIVLSIVMGIGINCVVLSEIFSNPIEIISGEQYREVEEYTFPDVLLNKEDCMVQYFKPKHKRLIRIEIRLAFNNDAVLNESGAKIRLRIRDKAQNILKEEILDSDEIPNWRYCTLWLDTTLECGERYALELQQIEGPVDESTGNYILSYVPFIYQIQDGIKIKENGSCEYHGSEQDYKMDLYYVYKCIDYGKLILLGLSDICYFLILLLMPYYMQRFANRKWTYVYLVCFPLCEYIIIECIVGNLLTIQPRYHFVNVGILYIVCFFVVLFFENLKLALYIANVCFPILALVEYYVYKLRGRSFMIQDIASLRTACAVMTQYNYDFECKVGIALLVVCVLIYILFLLPKVKIELFAKTKKLVLLFLAIGLFLGLTNRGLMRNLEFTQIDLWNIENNYQKQGYLFSLLCEMQFLAQDKPDNYSIESVASIRDYYVNQYSEESNCVMAKQPENIIFIMNESWADFRNIDSEFPTVTTYIDSLDKNVKKGYVQVPVFGAGTSNSEYEALTGNSMQQFLGDNPYQLYTADNEWGMASTLKSQEYSTTAMHPYFAKNWNRNLVYSYMKFDDFYSSEQWCNDEIDCIRWCASDETCYEAVMQLYEEKSVDDKWFSFIVTMQNHGGYDFEGFESTVDLNYNVDYPETEQYLSLIQKSDEAFAELVEYFARVDEPTMIIMFGDHLPNVEQEFYGELFGMPVDELDLLTRQKLYQTPFVIWTNYDMDEQYDLHKNLISSNYLGSYILQMAGVEITDYDKCLLEFCKEVPVIGMGMIMDKNGVWHERETLDKELDDILNEYQILQYNRVFGRSKRVDDMFSLNP